VNDAPVATSDLHETVFSQSTTKLSLFGADIDSQIPFGNQTLGQILLRARIHQLPRFGFLYLLEEGDHLTPGQLPLVAKPNCSVFCSIPLLHGSPFNLIYQYTGPEIVTPGVSVLAEDVFTFSVEDTASAISLPVPYHLKVIIHEQNNEQNF
jgi:hypothetical protein